ncbi:MAG: YggS family pyridoxal phosphate-dependent enzyme [Bdellovibrionota bacterium]
MSVARNLHEIRSKIFEACKRSNRDANDITLLAVTKFQPLERIFEAYDAGLRDFGENYVQELLERRKHCSHLKEIRWHLIGHLQSNKVKQALGAMHVFQALDSPKLIHELARRQNDQRASALRVYIQVNIDREPLKAGVAVDEVESLVRLVRSQEGLKLEGLMCIPAKAPSSEGTRPAFRKLRELAKRFQQDEPLKLSMGMSDDFEVAIEEGSHCVRLGTRLFGSRERAF